MSIDAEESAMCAWCGETDRHVDGCPATFRAFTPTGMRQLDPSERTTITWEACPTCGNSPCECSASVGQDGVTAIDRSKVPWRVWRDVSPYATVEAGLITWP